jgi:hypothetical protein
LWSFCGFGIRRGSGTGKVVDPSISDQTADHWLATWQELLGTEPEMEAALRYMSTAIAYKKQPAHQKRLWLGLAKEERSILNQALGLEPQNSDDTEAIDEWPG